MGLVRTWFRAAVLGGAPSTVHALLTGRDALAATRAAGTLLGAPGVVRGVLAHVGVSAVWTCALAAVDRRRPLGAAGGAVAGAAIAWLDLVVLGRLFPAVRALPRGPQWADHVVFGALVGASLRASRLA
ncbi:hypothetical protein ABZ816_39745 [Actinosynnema sp. NPDC047251]|uniref:Uncharacterized protein n=1 Tax=Saccharothrix espanaensis (strain ATCC 51144 / DSM 44229 / JCM 9112 / NBRC 15066 / NRRL 15764) TaxID=1179773 RepID=K0JSF9_SACES|nr:hypothetical protein [Saccharothrix espanaensis]CCH30595.1 hypothetical protein BN6_32910 [Saccharothrix espanaensis DSM 44229]